MKGEDDGGGGDDEVEGQAGDAEQVVAVQPGAAAAFVGAQCEEIGGEGRQVEDEAGAEGKGVEDGDKSHQQEADVFVAEGAGDACGLVQAVGQVAERGVAHGAAVQLAVGIKPGVVFLLVRVNPAERHAFVVVQVQGEFARGFGVGGEGGADESGGLCGVVGVRGLRRCRPAVEGVAIDAEAAGEKADEEQEAGEDAAPGVQRQLGFEGGEAGGFHALRR